MKPVRTWILLADGAHARVLLNEGPGKGVRQLKADAIGLPQSDTKVEMSDRPGRVHDSHGAGRHAMEGHESPCETSKRLFAEKLSTALSANIENYDRLVLIAAPETLGALRNALPSDVEAKVHGTLPKDLTGTPTEDIPGFLDDVMVI